MRHIFLKRSHSMKLALFAVIIIAQVLGFSTHQAQASEPPPCTPYNPQKEDPPYCAGDHRVNPRDPIAPLTAYCQEDHSLTLTAIVNSQGVDLYNIPATNIANGLAAARASGSDVVVADQMGRQLWALASGELLMNDSTKGYQFRFAGDFCGLVPATGSNQPMVSNDSASSSDTTTNGTSVVITWLNLRSFPTTQAAILTVLPIRSTVQLIGRNANMDWVKVKYQGMVGWVYEIYSGVSQSVLEQLPVVGN